MELFPKDRGTDWFRTSEWSRGTNYPWAKSELKFKNFQKSCARLALLQKEASARYTWFVIFRGYKPIFLHKVVGGYLQKSCKLCHCHWFTYMKRKWHFSGKKKLKLRFLNILKFLLFSFCRFKCLFLSKLSTVADGIDLKC